MLNKIPLCLQAHLDTVFVGKTLACHEEEDNTTKLIRGSSQEEDTQHPKY